MADRIAAKQSAHSGKADEWGARLDAMDKAEPAAFDAGDAVLDQQEQSLKEMESTMRALSNLPPLASTAKGS